jgi:hypothetical protein
MVATAGRRRGKDVNDWLKDAIGGAVGGVQALIAAVATGWISYASKDEELRVHLVEIAIGILRADPAKEDVAPARASAMDAIDKYSGLRPFTAEERSALLHKPIGGEWSPAMWGVPMPGRVGIGPGP